LDSQRLVSRLALGACFFAFGVIALGAFTRLIDAGLGCPDWPGCYGHWVVQATDSYKAWAEMIHRYFAGCLSLLIVTIVIFLFKKDLRKRINIFLALILILLILYQIMLGQWTVTLKLLPIIVTQHLLGGFLILATLWSVYLNNTPIVRVKKNVSLLFPFAILGLVLILVQICLGAWTSTNYASLSCPDFPFCQNNQPDMTFYFKQAYHLLTPVGMPTEIRQTIQMTHRIGALVLTIYLFLLTLFSFFQLKDYPKIMSSLFILLALLSIQLCLGIANVIFKLPLVTAVSHNLVAALLLLTMISFIFKLKASE